jgi:hypothetical protein
MNCRYCHHESGEETLCDSLCVELYVQAKFREISPDFWVAEIGRGGAMMATPAVRRDDVARAVEAYWQQRGA